MDAEKAKILSDLGDISEDVYDDLVKDLCGQVKVTAAEMRAAVVTGNFKKLADLAHFLKGAAANLRVERINDAAKNIEALAKGESGLDQIKGHVAALEAAAREAA